MLIKSAVVIGLAMAAWAASPVEYNVASFGALGDGHTINTVAIQKAIEAASAAGGGVVLVPAGTFVSGTIQLRSNVTLRILPGGMLKGSGSISDYPQLHLILANGVRNAAIDGGGVIDGNGEAFWDMTPAERYYRPHGKRPSPLIEFADCRDVRIENVIVQNAPGWTIHPLRCDGVRIRGVAIYNHQRGANTDGIDPDSSSNVTIADCYIEGGDDAIVIKSPLRPGAAPQPAQNITVTNCTISSTSNCIKLGTESRGGFRNIAITNCIMYRPASYFRAPISGIAIEMVDGGVLDGVVVSNLTMRDVGTPIFIRLGNRGRGMEVPATGILRNVSISNVVATGGLITNSITGLPGHPVRGVSLSDINITMSGGQKEPVGLDVDEKADSYPEAWMFGVLPAYGFYARHVDGLSMRNVRLKWEREDVRPAVVFDDVHNTQLDSLQAESVPSMAPVIRLHQSDSILIRAAQTAPGSPVFLKATGDKTGRIFLRDCDLVNARKLAETGEGAAVDAVRH
ncbi:MAG: glycoside hydrolase family 28 protein [Bryobacterales bacterium]|nr:glycoside hydrolase family 28 protein [Bryobacterales bacterium]